jgi:LPXTG-motif cell wall-anchored protein
MEQINWPTLIAGGFLLLSLLVLVVVRNRRNR